MTESSKISLQDIAERAKVTPRTVARVLSGDYAPTQAKAVRRAERIRQLATDMGYRPNASARATRTGRFGAVSLILSQSAELGLIPGGLLTGIDERLGQKNIHLTICHTDLHASSNAAESHPHKIFKQSLVDGYMIDLEDQVPAAFDDPTTGLPNIWLRGQREADCIYLDERRAGYDATRYLLERGHRKIAAAYGEILNAPAARARLEGFHAAMAEAGLPSRDLVYPKLEKDPSESSAIAHHCPRRRERDYALRMTAGKAWFASQDRPTAVVGIWHNDALSIQAAVLQSKLSLPDDVALVTMHDRLLNEGFPITLFASSMTRFGRVAAEMMLEKIEQPARPLDPVAMPYVFESGMTA